MEQNQSKLFTILLKEFCKDMQLLKWETVLQDFHKDLQSLLMCVIIKYIIQSPNRVLKLQFWFHKADLPKLQFKCALPLLQFQMHGPSNGSLEYKDSLENIIRFICYFNVNAGLETRLFMDLRIQIHRLTLRETLRESILSWFHTKDSNRSSIDFTEIKDEICIQDTLNQISKLHLSVSPHVHFPPPYLLSHIHTNANTNTHPSQTENYLSNWFSKKEKSLTVSPNVKLGLGYITFKENALDLLLHHQTLAYSFSIHLTSKTSLPCQIPKIHRMHYYQNQQYPDQSLCDYILHRYAHRLESCLNCFKSLSCHIYSYSHFQYRLLVTMDTNTISNTLDGSIYVYIQCKACQTCTIPQTLSPESCFYSFGKFLELLFYHSQLIPKDLCSHSKESLVFIFLYKDMSLVFDCDVIELFDIQVPKKSFELNNVDVKGLDLIKKESCAQVTEFYGYLKNCLLQMAFSTLPKNKEKVGMMLQDMQTIFEEEQNTLIQQMHSTSLHGLNNLRRRFLFQVSRDWSHLQTWQTEYAPSFVFEPVNWTYLEDSTLFLDHGIVIRPNEPTSLISFTLLSKDYQYYLYTSDDKNGQYQSDWKSTDGNQQSRIKLFHHLDKSCSQHIKYQIQNELNTYSCTVYYARQFKSLRKQFGIDQDFAYSLSRCTSWSTTGGKSKAEFFKTSDDQWIIKQLKDNWKDAEKDHFLNFTPKYLEYIKQTDKNASILTRIFGCYSIKIKNRITGAIVLKKDLIIMEHLFSQKDISKKFDLKGIPDRQMKSIKHDTGLDKDWEKGRYQSLCSLHSHSKKIITRAVENDTKFLTDCQIMDYSLLVGIHTETKQIIVGIIDFIGYYTLLKRIEGTSKSLATQNVTVLAPQFYAQRFRNAIHQYFSVVPDKWIQQEQDETVKVFPLVSSFD